MSEQNNYILWLPSWYPTDITVSNGDFIERHAKATALYNKIIVLFVQKDERLKVGKTRIEIKEENNLVTIIGYYGSTGQKGILEKAVSYFQYKKLQKTLFNQVYSKYGLPDLVHVHIAMNAGMLGLYLKKKFKLPLLLTENWTGYYQQSKPNLFDENVVLSHIRKKIFQQTDLFLPVTKHLGKRVNELFQNVRYEVVPNVVDTGVFRYVSNDIPVFRFIHVSYLNYQKNPEGIIEAAMALKKLNYTFELQFIGNDDARLKNICSEAGLLDQTIFFEPAKSYEAVAQAMQHASAFVLFSRFENLPCVILEALCCGLPIISSHVGGVSEVVDDSNGLLVESENVPELIQAMKHVMENSTAYNRSAIADTAIKQFSYKTVGASYSNIYQRVLTSQ